jgi:soluble lytic murein transglycosylase-like protein
VLASFQSAALPGQSIRLEPVQLKSTTVVGTTAIGTAIEETAVVPAALSLSSSAAKRGDPILEAYLDSAQRDQVQAFFAAFLRSEHLAHEILSNAAAFDIPPSLAFALCWEESRFNPQALNQANRDSSIDRGLFQLNSNSFPDLSEAEFYNPKINAYYGMSHLRWCLDAGGSLVAGIAMYNAGTGRVKAAGAPKTTLDYISHILESQRKIEESFAAHQVPVMEAAPVAELVYEEPAPRKTYADKPRLAFLSPIAGRP